MTPIKRICKTKVRMLESWVAEACTYKISKSNASTNKPEEKD
jgi:hypothetical protein